LSWAHSDAPFRTREVLRNGRRSDIYVMMCLPVTVPRPGPVGYWVRGFMIHGTCTKPVILAMPDHVAFPDVALRMRMLAARPADATTIPKRGRRSAMEAGARAARSTGTGSPATLASVRKERGRRGALRPSCSRIPSQACRNGVGPTAASTEPENHRASSPAGRKEARSCGVAGRGIRFPRFARPADDSGATAR
jgi:hypothetical protein